MLAAASAVEAIFAQEQKMTRAILSVGILVAASLSLSGPALAAPAAAATPPKAATGVVCQVTKSGNVVHIEARNKGTAAVPAGATFAFTIIGPTKKTDETITFKKDLAPGKSVSVTNAIKAKNVVGCAPSA